MTNFKFIVATCLAGALTLTSCEKDNGVDTPIKKEVAGDFHIAFANGTGSPSGTLVQGVKSLSEGAITSSKGYQLESARTARIFPSTDGKTIWSLNFTVGTVEKLSYLGSDQYQKVTSLDTSIPLGAKNVRFTKVNDQLGSIHLITATAKVSDAGVYEGHEHKLTIGLLDLDKMEIKPGFRKATPLSLPTELAQAGYFISRIDAPVLSGGKLYYGCAVSKANPAQPTGRGTASDKALTLVVDYNDLSQTSIITTDIARGSTNGYRTPTQHIAEDGSILQLVSGVQANKQNEVHILKIQNGQYTAFNFDLTGKLGKQTRSNGFFYAGGGIAYIPYEDLSRSQVQIGVDPQGQPTTSAMWKLARVDLNAGTAVDLEVPDNLWLTQYQNAVVRDGVFYIALAPIGQKGNVYLFDVKSSSPKGRLGAALEGTGAEQYFIGIY